MSVLCPTFRAYILDYVRSPGPCPAFERGRREKGIGVVGRKRFRKSFEDDCSSGKAVLIDADLTRHSARLAEKHGLRAADAIHLAAFERILAAAEDDDVRFLCADYRLTKAARSLG